MRCPSLPRWQVIAPALIGMDPADQKTIDDKMVQELVRHANDSVVAVAEGRA